MADPASLTLAAPAATGAIAAALADVDSKLPGAANGSGHAALATAGADDPAPDPIALNAAAPALLPIRASAPPPAATITLPTDPDAGFDDAFGTRIAWMADQRIGHAEIHISPAHIGPIDVRVQLDGNCVTAQFHSVHAEVRQALEASLPNLRDLLGQHGLQLGQADIGQRQTGSGQGHERRLQFGDSGRADAGEIAIPSVAAPHRPGRGLLDEYA